MSRAVFRQHAWQDQPGGHGQYDQKCVAPFAATLVKPGIIETTAEKPNAANGKCQRSTTGCDDDAETRMQAACALGDQEKSHEGQVFRWKSAPCRHLLAVVLGIPIQQGLLLGRRQIFNVGIERQPSDHEGQAG